MTARGLQEEWHRNDSINRFNEWFRVYTQPMRTELTPTPEHIPSHVIYSGNATIAIFPDGKKVVSRPRGDDEYDKEVGLAMCIAKRVYGGRKEFMEAVERATIQNKEEKCKTQKYWHELGDEEREVVKSAYLSYSQPEWCLRLGALAPSLGCHYLWRGWIWGEESILCANCEYSKTQKEA